MDSPPRRHGRLTLAERSAASGIGTIAATSPAAASSSSSTSSTPPRAVPASGVRVPRHVWVVDPPGAAGTFPGVLVEWARTPAGWAGYVVVGVPEGPDVVSLRAWIPADRLRPA